MKITHPIDLDISADEAIASCEAGIDYISITPMFPKESRVFAKAEAAGIPVIMDD